MKSKTSLVVVWTSFYCLFIGCSQCHSLQTILPSGQYHARASNGSFKVINNSHHGSRSLTSSATTRRRSIRRTSSEQRRRLHTIATTTTSLSATIPSEIMMIADAVEAVDINTVTTAAGDIIMDSSIAESSSIPILLLAQGLGYLVGIASLVLYTPIALRIIRNKQSAANGLKISTWWLKVLSYSCSDIYAYKNNYPISTYIETIIITLEAMLILILVSYYQKQTSNFNSNNTNTTTNNNNFVYGLVAYGIFVITGITIAPPEVIAIGQGSAALLNVGALIPQFQLNYSTKTSGDYSPITAGLATTGCLIRIFTTIQLAGSDPLLLSSFGLAFLLNGSLFGQILYYGILVEKKTFKDVMLSDWKTTAKTTTTKENTKGKYLPLLRRMGSTATSSSSTASNSETTTTDDLSEFDIALMKKEEDLFV